MCQCNAPSQFSELQDIIDRGISITGTVSYTSPNYTGVYPNPPQHTGIHHCCHHCCSCCCHNCGCGHSNSHCGHGRRHKAQGEQTQPNMAGVPLAPQPVGIPPDFFNNSSSSTFDWGEIVSVT